MQNETWCRLPYIWILVVFHALQNWSTFSFLMTWISTILKTDERSEHGSRYVHIRIELPYEFYFTQLWRKYSLYSQEVAEKQVSNSHNKILWNYCETLLISSIRLLIMWKSWTEKLTYIIKLKHYKYKTWTWTGVQYYAKCHMCLLEEYEILFAYALSALCRDLQHTLRKQPYGSKVLHVQQDLPYGVLSY
jgi:hypothetical protein